jgi:osmotically-inducible protein OsmY
MREGVLMVRERKATGLFMLLFLVLLIHPGCVAMTGETAGESVDDTVITSQVKAKLTAEKASYSTRISVKTERGIVYLTGSVETADDNSKVVKIAKGVTGVRDVVDHLEVKP